MRPLDDADRVDLNEADAIDHFGDGDRPAPSRAAKSGTGRKGEVACLVQGKGVQGSGPASSFTNGRRRTSCQLKRGSVARSQPAPI